MGRGSLEGNIVMLGRAASTEFLIGVMSVDNGSEVVPEEEEEMERLD